MAISSASWVKLVTTVAALTSEPWASTTETASREKKDEEAGRTPETTRSARASRSRDADKAFDSGPMAKVAAAAPGASTIPSGVMAPQRA
ncbi:hypothetical protein HPB52_005772 [Rhipicephalus sanguineus]|uniref:Secreted protein n=1 Tax=Rhipicephalus sanguineus TaxID=34632 RepID=A0A9D4QGW3_RHISA|nr:hypothetical protein HPB52_005772 [Rhipicephalus sanguineus]